MKKTGHIKNISSLFLICISLLFSDPGNSIQKLDTINVQSYLSPMATMFGTGFNSGYFRKASTHNALGFDFTLDVAYPMMPSNSTTYDYVVPDNPFEYIFQFQLKEDDLNIPGNAKDIVLSFIDETDDPELFYNESITITTPLNKLIYGQDVPTVIGDIDDKILEFDYDESNQNNELYDQIISDIWTEIEDIPGIGTKYYVYEELGDPQSIDDDRLVYEMQPRFSNIQEFRDFALQEDFETKFRNTLGSMDIRLTAPGGFDYLFQETPFSTGLKLPIIQASLGFPYYFQLTMRALPEVSISSFGNIQYAGIGGKCNISHLISKLLDLDPRYRKELDIKSYTKVFSQNIRPKDVKKAIADIKKAYGKNYKEIKYLDSLNYLFRQGEIGIVEKIQSKVQETLERKDEMPRAQNDEDDNQLPLDVSLGYYINYYKLDFGNPEVISKNKMFSIHLGKTYETPFSDWLGSYGFYTGIGFESSELDLSYEYTDITNITTNESINFKGKNTVRSLIGFRMRILFIDAYIDYNLGTSRTVNAGFGLTIN